jgi:hypothetical protein
VSLPLHCLGAALVLLCCASQSMASPPGPGTPTDEATDGQAADSDQSDRVVREIELDDKSKLPRSRTRVVKPTVIENPEELAKLITHETLRTQIGEQVDFASEHLLVFAWAGSGADKITTDVTRADDAARVVFLYTPGRTRDLRPHVHLFVIEQEAKWIVRNSR